MSTYTREGRFTPVNINSDPSQQLNYVQQRMGLQAKGESIIRSQYQTLLDLELSHNDNQDKLNNFFKGINEKINKAVSSDTSNFSNVQETLNVFDPLTKSPEYQSVILDNQYTKHYKQELGKAQYFKNKEQKDGSVGTSYSDYNYKELVDNYTKFKSSKGSDPDSWGGLYTYKPYYDYTEEQRKKIADFMRLPDKHSEDKMDKNGITTTITYEGKSADQIQRYLEANLSAKAQDQMLLEGRVNSQKLTDTEYIALLQKTHKSNIDQTKDRIAQLRILKDKRYDKQIEALETELPLYQENHDKLFDPEIVKSELLKKEGTFANYYLNKKIASFAIANDNSRVSSELGTNSAFVNALNRQADLWKFSQKFAQDQQQFNADQQYKYAALASAEYQTKLKEGLIGLDGKPLSNNGLGPNQVLKTTDIKDEDQQITREKQEEELQGGIQQVLSQSLPYVKGAFGEPVGKNPTEASQNYLSELVKLSNKLQTGDKETLDLLRSGDSKLTPQQKDKKKLLEILHDNEDKVMAYKAYNQQKQEIIQGTKQQVLSELKKSGITIEQANKLLNDNENPGLLHSVFAPASALRQYLTKDTPGTFNSLESLAESLVDNPELADKFKSASSSIRSSIKNNLNNYDGKTNTGILGNDLTGLSEGERWLKYPLTQLAIHSSIPSIISQHTSAPEYTTVPLMKKVADVISTDIGDAFDNIKNIGVQAQLQINQNLNNSYFSTQKELVTHKPLDTESTAAKVQLSQFNNALTKFLPYLGETADDFNSTMVTSFSQDKQGVTINYQPSEMVEGKLVPTGDPIKEIRIDSPMLGMGINDQRDKLLLGTMTLSPTGETPNMIAKGQVPFQYKIGTSSGGKFSKNEMGDGKFIAKVVINNKTVVVPQEFLRPSEVEDFMSSISNNTALAVLKELKYDLEKKNKAPLTTEQKTELMDSGAFKKLFDTKLKEAFEKGKVFSTFGVSNPDHSDLENLFLKD